LRSYFEPTSEEKAQGIKMPTVAHRAIAELVKAEYIRIIVTTNFDRLVEMALTDVGIQPMIVSTADGVKGALPLSHIRCLVLKINGDYLDSRIRNTQAELSVYDSALTGILDRIFDEFGLIVCGWSGDWDIGLRAAIERCPTRRFSMYWATRGETSAKATDLITLRAGIPVKIQSADSFFGALKEKTLALAEFGQHHPLSAKLAGALVKRYIVRAENRILLHDLVYDETEKAYGQMDPEKFHGRRVSDVSAELAKRLSAYESIMDVLLEAVITGCYWGSEHQDYIWRHVAERLGDPPGPTSGLLIAWTALRLYPASLVVYGGGIGAILANKFSTLAALLKAQVAHPYADRTASPLKTVTAANRVHYGTVLENGLAEYMPGKKSYSNYLFDLLGARFSSFDPSQREYEVAFDVFEYCLGLIVQLAPATTVAWSPVGRAAWRASSFYEPDGPTSPSNARMAAIAEALFERGIDEYRVAKTAYDKWVLRRGLP